LLTTYSWLPVCFAHGSAVPVYGDWSSGYNRRDYSPCTDSLSLRLRHRALTSPRTLSRRFMMHKVRNQAFPCGHSPLPACRHSISGSFDSPHRGSFHLSLAVLVHYRSTGSIQAYGMVPADSGRIARVPPYLRLPLGQPSVPTTGLSPSVARLSRRLVYRGPVLNAVPLPRRSFLRRFGLFRFRSPLLTESRLLSFPRGTEMFHFP